MNILNWVDVHSSSNIILLFSLDKDCPSRLGYDTYNTGGCKDRNELGMFNDLLDNCIHKCNQDSSCISVEFAKPTSKNLLYCSLSKSCTHDLSVKKESDSNCLYQKQGLKTSKNFNYSKIY